MLVIWYYIETSQIYRYHSNIETRNVGSFRLSTIIYSSQTPIASVSRK
jgi:hypothetical protein